MYRKVFAGYVKDGFRRGEEYTEEENKMKKTGKKSAA